MCCVTVPIDKAHEMSLGYPMLSVIDSTDLVLSLSVETYWLTDHCMTRRWHSITILQYASEEVSIQIS